MGGLLILIAITVSTLYGVTGLKPVHLGCPDCDDRVRHRRMGG